MKKRPAEKSNAATVTAHPEVKPSHPQPGAPGTENSKTQQASKDSRSGHDKDGNGAQRPS